ncbi:hypothetical protein [Stenotrophomonas sp. 278]|uniref:hypothetical protein n=1 Tax=Stenotrophomonas sp. 278 TaxID=2479851 RepID=UPI000F67265B|nr:hypothetical protein [Stenotrophomonas sp. 278]
MTRCKSSGLTRKPLNMSFGCGHAELKPIALASDHAHLWDGNGMPIHLEAVVKEPVADLDHCNDERMPVNDATESLARGIGRHRDGCLNGQPHFTDEFVQREVSSPRRCFAWKSPLPVKGISSPADGPPCEGIIGVQLAGNFSRGVQGRTSSSLLAGEITFQVDRFESSSLTLSVDHGCCVPSPGAIHALAYKRYQPKAAFPIFHTTSSKKRMEEAIEALFATASMLSITTATFPNEFSMGRLGPCTSAKAEHASGPYLRQSSPALYQIPRHLLGRLQSSLARRLIGHGSFRSSDPLYSNRQHAPLVSTAAPQVDRVTPSIHRQVNAVKRFWSNSYCHLSYPDCTQFDTALSSLWPQGRKSASKSSRAINQRVGPDSRFDSTLVYGLNDAFERSELLNLRFQVCLFRPRQDNGGQKAPGYRVHDQVQLKSSMHHAHVAHPRPSQRLKVGCYANAMRHSHTAAYSDFLSGSTAGFKPKLPSALQLPVDLLNRETNTDVQGLLESGSIRQVQSIKRRPSHNADGMNECAPTRRLPRLHRESDAEQRAIYVFLQYETTAHPTNPMWRIGGIVFLAQQAVNAVKRCQDRRSTGQFLTIHLWIRGLRPGGRNDLIGNKLPLLEGRKARAGMEIDMPHNCHIVDLDLLKPPTRVALSYKLTRVGVPTNGKRDSSQTHTSLRRCLQAESAPVSETAQGGVLPIPIHSSAVHGSNVAKDFYRPPLQNRCDDAPAASRVTFDPDTDGIHALGAPHGQLSGAGRASVEGADVRASKPLSFLLGLYHALAPRGHFKGSQVRAVRPENMYDAPPIPAVMDCGYNHPVGVQFCSGRHLTDPASSSSIVPIRRRTVAHAFSRYLIARFACSQFGEPSNRPTQTSIERIHQTLVLPTLGLVNHRTFPNFHVAHDGLSPLRLTGLNKNVVAVAGRSQRIKLQFLSHFTLPHAPRIVKANHPTVNREASSSRYQGWVALGWHRMPGTLVKNSAESSKDLHGGRTFGELSPCI